MLLNVCRALNSGWPLQIQADATYAICAEAVGLLGFGVNSLGAHIHLVGMAIIPESESTKLYTETWTAIREALHSLLTNFVFCPIHGCQCCEAVRAVKEDPYTQEMLDSTDFSRDKHIPVAFAGSDNSSAFRLFCKNELHLKADQCFAHLTGIYFCCVGSDRTDLPFITCSNPIAIGKTYEIFQSQGLLSSIQGSITALQRFCIQ